MPKRKLVSVGGAELEDAYNALQVLRLKRRMVQSGVASQNCKLGGLGGLELVFAYNTLLKLKETFVHATGDPIDDESLAGSSQEAPTVEFTVVEREMAERFEGILEQILPSMEARVEGPKSLSFSSMAMKDLEKLYITPAGFLHLKPDNQERIDTTSILGRDEHWSSGNLYRHLELLEALFQRTDEASPHAWIDAFFFRVSAMVPCGKQMALSIEHVIPAMAIDSSSFTELSGLVDYSAIIADPGIAVHFLEGPQMTFKRHLASGFFVVEAKMLNISEQVPRAICKLYACAKAIQEDIVRGALTNGHEWIFLIIELNSNGDGVTYKISDIVKLYATQVSQGPREIEKSQSDLIAGILSYWIMRSSADYEGDDWFELESSL